MLLDGFVSFRCYKARGELSAVLVVIVYYCLHVLIIGAALVNICYVFDGLCIKIPRGVEHSIAVPLA